ncbi:DUF6624 domain-containing protein [Chromobacterium sp. IIBBL 290-4]|uniref:DUF6624 domain-containing protein n=1 Tax=Chromobacterium sp. IIBBL 290-4 TaxID=2953890 RepID=UPI0020B6D151|nr:DUF6624 domain-containing protein [Chromobacterium sp. IIBBL 290-4]UTH72483.1 hypothetical protein NKT35_13075 [Chromobacterium sp. IIBBL 290-4]
MKRLALIITLSIPFSAQAACDWQGIGRQLRDTVATDQGKRTEMMRYEEAARAKGAKPDPAKLEAMWKEQEASDQANQRMLDEVTARCGWPRTPDVDKPAVHAAFMILQHASTDPKDIEYRRRYWPMLQESQRRGDLDASVLALFEDRMLLQEGKPQKYGTQVDAHEGVTVSQPLQDPARLDERRKAVGLPPICQYLQLFTALGGAIRYPACSQAGASSRP